MNAIVLISVVGFCFIAKLTAGCQDNEYFTSYSFKDGSFSKTCRPGPPNKKCYNELDRCGIQCRNNYILFGAAVDSKEPGMKRCCKKKGICLTNCYTTCPIYSYMNGFNVSYPDGYVPRSRLTTALPHDKDPTIFKVEFCKLTPC